MAGSFSKATKAGLDGLIFTFAFEPSVSSNFVQNVRKQVEVSGGEVDFVKLECGPLELERRITDSSREKFDKLTSLAQFRELEKAGTFVDPGVAKNNLVLDITNLSPADAANRIVRELGLNTNPSQALS